MQSPQHQYTRNDFKFKQLLLIYLIHKCCTVKYSTTHLGRHMLLAYIHTALFSRSGRDEDVIVVVIYRLNLSAFFLLDLLESSEAARADSGLALVALRLRRASTGAAWTAPVSALSGASLAIL